MSVIFLKSFHQIFQLDFGSETWSTDPNRLFSCLQSLILSNHQKIPVKSTEDRSSSVSRGYIKKLLHITH